MADIDLRDITSNDAVIAVMGATGVGKSTFINYASKQDGRYIGHDLNSCTAGVRTVRCKYKGMNVVLVDTPGFDDSHKSDTEILKLIAVWLEETYRSNIKLAGVIYMQRISDNRMPGAVLKNLHMFAHLCGDAVHNVVLVTTMWKHENKATAEQRERELRRTYWRGMIDMGSIVERFRDSYGSAWEILGKIVERNDKESLLLQEELVDLKRRLAETKAGSALYESLQKAFSDQKEIMRQLREQAQGQNSPALVRDLNKRYDGTQDTVNRIFSQIQEMKIPLGRRILMFFSFKKSKANPIKVFGK